MKQSAPYQRALILHQQRRYADAEKELRQALAQEPRDAHSHAMLALCLVEQSRFREATAEAEQAIGIEPDEPFGYYAMAKVLLDRHRPGDAEIPIKEAIRLDPYNADYFALLSSIRLEQRAWPSALEAAEKGLELDAENEACTNLRAIALVQLGRREQAGATIGAALQRNPENSITHANQGWTLLHERQPKQAMVHFREALRLDPTNDWARAGIVEAIKARNPLYRIVLMYFLWMARLSKRAQWGIIVGGYVGYRIALSIRDQAPAAAPYLQPLIWAYMVFAAMTWLAYPLFNLALRLHPFGRLALSDDQRRGANLTSIVLAAALISIGIYFWKDSEPALIAGLVLALLLMPTAAIFLCSNGWPRWTMAGVTFAMLLLGLVSIPLGGLWMLFIYGILASAFFANWLMAQKPKR